MNAATLLFVLVLHRFGDADTMIFNKPDERSACVSYWIWMQYPHDYAAKVFSIAPDYSASLPSIIATPMECNSYRPNNWRERSDFYIDLKEVSAQVAGDICRKHAQEKDWKTYFHCVAENIEYKMSDAEYKSILDDIDRRVKELEDKAWLEKGRRVK